MVFHYAVQTMLKNCKLSNDLKDSPRVSRQSKLNSRDQSLLYRRVWEDPKISYRGLSAEFCNKAGYISVIYSIVRRCLSKKSIDCYVAARKPLLRVTDRIKRYKGCKERHHWSVEGWSKVIFSDESNFEVFNCKSRFIVKRLASKKCKERFCVPRVQGSIGIWECISHKGIGFQNIYTGRIARSFFGRHKNWIF